MEVFTIFPDGQLWNIYWDGEIVTPLVIWNARTDALDLVSEDSGLEPAVSADGGVIADCIRSDGGSQVVLHNLRDGSTQAYETPGPIGCALSLATDALLASQAARLRQLQEAQAALFSQGADRLLCIEGVSLGDAVDRIQDGGVHAGALQ
jgi:hypothetical protein